MSALSRNKSVKSAPRSSLLTSLTRKIDNGKALKRVVTPPPIAQSPNQVQTTPDGMVYTSTEDKPWSCKVCKREYKWKNSLNCHIKNECGKPPKFFCARNCGYKTNINSNMKRHMNSNCKPRFTI